VSALWFKGVALSHLISGHASFVTKVAVLNH